MLKKLWEFYIFLAETLFRPIFDKQFWLESEISTVPLGLFTKDVLSILAFFDTPPLKTSYFSKITVFLQKKIQRLFYMCQFSVNKVFVIFSVVCALSRLRLVFLFFFLNYLKMIPNGIEKFSSSVKTGRTWSFSITWWFLYLPYSSTLVFRHPEPARIRFQFYYVLSFGFV